MNEFTFDPVPTVSDEELELDAYRLRLRLELIEEANAVDYPDQPF